MSCLKKNFVFILLLLCSSLFSHSVVSQENEENILIYAMPYDFYDFSAYTGGSYPTNQWQSATLAGLFTRQVEKYRDYGPNLAEGEPILELVDDEMVVTVSLKPGLKFYNGEDLTASDIVFSYKVLLSPEINWNTYNELAYYFDANESIIALNDLTVEFTINQHYAFYKRLLSGAIIPEDYYTDLYDAGDYDFNNPSGIDANGAGPFMVKEIDTSNVEVIVEKNPFWHGTAPRVDQIIFKTIYSLEDAKSQLAAGKIHILDSQYAPEKTAYTGIVNVSETFIGDPSTYEMSFNFNNGWLNGSFTPLGVEDPSRITDAGKYVRKALSHLFDRQKAVDDYLGGLGQPANVLMPSVIQGWSGYGNHPVREYSIEIAKSLLEEAGYNYSTDVDLTSEITSENCLFELYSLFPQTSVLRYQWIHEYIEELPKIGIHVALHQGTGWAVIAPLTFNCPTPPPPGGVNNESELTGWDLFFVGLSWDLDYDPSGLFDSASIRPNGDNWYTFPGDTATLNGRSWDELLEDYTSTYDFDERMEKVKLLQDFLYEWEPTAPILYPQTHWGYSSSLIGVDWVLLSFSFQQWERIEILLSPDDLETKTKGVFATSSLIVMISGTLAVLTLIKKKLK